MKGRVGKGQRRREAKRGEGMGGEGGAGRLQVSRQREQVESLGFQSRWLHT